MLSERKMKWRELHYLHVKRKIIFFVRKEWVIGEVFQLSLGLKI
jgi:hypothetical protein